MPICTVSLVATVLPPARPRTQTYQVPVRPKLTVSTSDGDLLILFRAQVTPVSGWARKAIPPEAVGSATCTQVCPERETITSYCSASRTMGSAPPMGTPQQLGSAAHTAVTSASQSDLNGTPVMQGSRGQAPA